MLVIQSPAKVNLTLDVVGRRADGYHFIESVMQSIDLSDYVTLTPVPVANGVQLVGNGVNADDVPTDESNLAHRAVAALRSAVVAGRITASGGIDGGDEDSVSERRADVPPLSIHIDKRIPVAAGLGGGSANAAAALIGANELWGLRLDTARLADIGVQLGADIPFCLLGGTAVARGIGEQLTPVAETPRLSGVVVTPDFSVSTAAVYGLYDEWHGTDGAAEREATENAARQRTEAIVAALSAGDVRTVASLLYNALEPVTTRLHPAVGELREKLLRAGALGATMCGSGPSVFGLAADAEHAAHIAERMSRSNLFVAACSFIGRGNRILEKERRV